INSVQFCDQRDANGWGKGACGARWSETSRYVSYGAGGFDPSAFTRVDITPSVSTYPPYGRSYQDEMANFARWYAFARTRYLAMKTAAGIGFATANLDNTIRVGFHTINSSFAANFLNAQDFTGSYKNAWFERFYSPILPDVPVTPSLNAMWRIGEYFSNRG